MTSFKLILITIFALILLTNACKDFNTETCDQLIEVS